MNTWVSSKRISRTIQSERLGPHTAPPSFSIPDSLPAISFTPGEFFASVARSNVLSTGSVLLMCAQLIAAKAAFEILINEPGLNFSVSEAASELGDAKLTGFAHDIGVGVANLYMERLGYIWRAHAKEIIRGGGKKPDYLYLNDQTSGEVVVSEAKGSVGATVTPSAMIKRVSDGYADQIEYWLGSTHNGLRIVHGYCVGTLAVCDSSDAKLYLLQTKWPAPSTPVTKSPRANSWPVLLANYETVFRLIGAPRIADAIQADLYKRPFETSDDVELFEVEANGIRFLTGAQQTAKWMLGAWVAPLHLSPMMLSPVFAIRANIARAFLSRLTGESGEFTNPLPVADEREITNFTENPLASLSPDGLALLPKPFRIVGSWVWSKNRGLKENNP